MTDTMAAAAAAAAVVGRKKPRVAFMHYKNGNDSDRSITKEPVNKNPFFPLSRPLLCPQFGPSNQSIDRSSSSVVRRRRAAAIRLQKKGSIHPSFQPEHIHLHTHSHATLHQRRVRAGARVRPSYFSVATAAGSLSAFTSPEEGTSMSSAG